MTALQQLFDRFQDGSELQDAFADLADQRGRPARAVRDATARSPSCTASTIAGGRPRLRNPASPDVRRFTVEHEPRVRFHEWCQWQIASQLASAGTAGLGLITDLAVGFDPSGADGWAYQDLLAADCRVGAPPDIFNQAGQDWGLPPFVPWKLRAARYEPLIRTMRAAFDHAAGIRIDHVMGLFRLYWLPPGVGPVDGAYVRYAGQELLDLVTLEAHRAGAFVVGEDLGTVEDDVREELAERDILSYRLLWFEDEPTDAVPGAGARRRHDPRPPDHRRGLGRRRPRRDDGARRGRGRLGRRVPAAPGPPDDPAARRRSRRRRRRRHPPGPGRWPPR